MTLVPYTGWTCLSCGQQKPLDSDTCCCDQQALVRVLVDEPDPDSAPAPSPAVTPEAAVA